MDCSTDQPSETDQIAAQDVKELMHIYNQSSTSNDLHKESCTTNIEKMKNLTTKEECMEHPYIHSWDWR